MRGRKLVLIFLIVTLVFLVYSCGGGGSGPSFSPPTDTPGLPYSLTLLPSQSVAQTNSSIILNAKVLDGNGIPVPNLQVTFTNLSEPFGVLKAALAKFHLAESVGILSATVVNTNNIGIAKVTLFSTTPGFATVQAEISNAVGFSRAKKTVFFGVNISPASPTLSLHADDGDGTFDEPNDFILLKGPNDNQRTIRADVLVGSSPVQGTTVTFGTDLPFKANADPTTTCSDGTSTCSVVFPNGNTSQTNQLGQAFTLLQVNPTAISSLGTVLNVTAQTTVNNQTASNLLSLFLSPVSVAGPPTSYLNALPSTIDTTKTSLVTAVVFLDTGAAAPDGTSVNFTVAPKTASDPSPCGTIDPFEQTTGGVTSAATFTPPVTFGICRVSGRVGGVLIGTADITVTAPATKIVIVPGSVTVASGKTPQTVQFTISGGTPPYTTTSTDPTKVFNDDGAGAHAGNGVLDSDEGGIWNGATIVATIPANAAAGSVTLNAFDSLGNTSSATITITGVGGAAAAMTISPTSLSVTGVAGAADNVTFIITGGTPPYGPPVFSDNTAVVPNATVMGSGSGPFTFTIDPNPVASSTSVKMQVNDSLGAFATTAVTVTPATSSMAINPGTIAVTNGAIITFNIIGGTPPYNVYSSDTTLLTVGGNPLTTSNTTFTANAVAKGAPTVTVVDSNSQTVSAKVTIN